jgi:uncharacterized protein YbaA (DUF1428 family)
MGSQQKYVDSFVMPVMKSKMKDYEQFANRMARIAERHGATSYVNCIADDVKPGKETSYPQAVKLHDDETVVCSWAVYPSREDRDRANKEIMDDDVFKQITENLPLDGKRMFMGGFKVLRGL